MAAVCRRASVSRPNLARHLRCAISRFRESGKKEWAGSRLASRTRQDAMAIQRGNMGLATIRTAAALAADRSVVLRRVDVSITVCPGIGCASAFGAIVGAALYRHRRRSRPHLPRHSTHPAASPRDAGAAVPGKGGRPKNAPKARIVRGRSQPRTKYLPQRNIMMETMCRHHGAYTQPLLVK